MGCTYLFAAPLCLLHAQIRQAAVQTGCQRTSLFVCMLMHLSALTCLCLQTQLGDHASKVASLLWPEQASDVAIDALLQQNKRITSIDMWMSAGQRLQVCNVSSTVRGGLLPAPSTMAPRDGPLLCVAPPLLSHSMLALTYRPP